MEKDFLIKYLEFCKTTCSPFENKEKEIMTYGLGLCGEAGDAAGCIKKIVSHKDNQLEGLKENLGDMMWYVARICSYYGWTIEELVQENIEKLSKRYPDGFKWEALQRGNKRIDWNEK